MTNIVLLVPWVVVAHGVARAMFDGQVTVRLQGWSRARGLPVTTSSVTRSRTPGRRWAVLCTALSSPAFDHLPISKGRVPQ